MKSCCVVQDHLDDERDKTVFHNTSDLQDQDQYRFFLVSDRSCPKTDGLRPHHCRKCTIPCLACGINKSSYRPLLYKAIGNWGIVFYSSAPRGLNSWLRSDWNWKEGQNEGLFKVIHDWESCDKSVVYDVIGVFIVHGYRKYRRMYCLKRSAMYRAEQRLLYPINLTKTNEIRYKIPQLHAASKEERATVGSCLTAACFSWPNSLPVIH